MEKFIKNCSNTISRDIRKAKDTKQKYYELLINPSVPEKCFEEIEKNVFEQTQTRIKWISEIKVAILLE